MVCSTLSGVVLEQLDAVDAHDTQQSVVTLLELVLPVLRLDGGELPCQDLHEKVPRAARRLKDAAVNTERFVPD